MIWSNPPFETDLRSSLGVRHKYYNTNGNYY